MLGMWIATVTAVGGLLVVAAHLVEHGVHTRRRWLWGLAMAAGPLVPALDAGIRNALPRTVTLDVVFGPAAPIWGAAARGLGAAATAGPVRAMAGIMAAGWVLATLALAALLAGGVARVRRARREWKRGEVDGVAVLLSEDFGPAVIGLRAPVIVLPRWVLELPSEERALVLTHEEEHRRRGDPRLMAAAFALAALLPWNLAGWWALFRLREAVETDCDARVLSRHAASRSRYAQLLFDVGSRSVGAVPLGAGFGERVSSLERRIREMLNAHPGRKRLAAQALVAAVLVLAACTLDVNVDAKSQKPQEQPTTTAKDAVEGAPGTVSVVPKGGPTFTPFTVAPKILNQTEVTQALARNYPPLLKDAGIGGRVLVYVYIDAQGKLQKMLIEKGSGHRALDAAALNVIGTMRFSPALNRDKPVAVWVTFPITFTVK